MKPEIQVNESRAPRGVRDLIEGQQLSHLHSALALDACHVPANNLPSSTVPDVHPTFSSY